MYEQPVTVDPDFPGHVIYKMLWELDLYGDLLKAVHLGTDLNRIGKWCQGFLDRYLKHKVNGYLRYRSADGSITDVISAVAHACEIHVNQLVLFDWISDEKRRELISLDVTIESDVRRCVDSADELGHDRTLWSHLTAVRAADTPMKLYEGRLST